MTPLIKLREPHLAALEQNERETRGYMRENERMEIGRDGYIYCTHVSCMQAQPPGFIIIIVCTKIYTRDHSHMIVSVYEHE